MSCINSGLQLFRVPKVSYAVVLRDAAVGHERALVDDRSRATQSLMLAARLLERALGLGLQPLGCEDPDGDGQASALPYRASMRLHAFSAASSL